MSIINSILKAFATPEAKRATAIIVAAGSGNRMGTSIPKQLIELDGMPVVVHSLLAFERCEKIKDIIVVAREEDFPLYNEIKKKYSLTKLRDVVKGGKTRQKSVLCGFNKIDKRCDFVCIHDAARCLVTPKNITDVLNEAEKYGAASAACKSKDTVKITDENGFVKETPDRENCWNAQTPQTFKADLYRAAAYYAKEKDFCATDDNSLIEFIGAKVRMVDCGYENIKITTPEDLFTAERILKNRRLTNG